MPIAKVQMPDGKIARFEVAEGTSPEEIEKFAFDNAPKMGTMESALNQAKQYGLGTLQASGIRDIQPEELNKLQYEASRQNTLGRTITDMGVGIPLQAAAALNPFTGGPVGSGAVSGGIQAGMLPASDAAERARNAAGGAVVGAAGGKVGQLVSKVAAPIVQPAKNFLQEGLQKATGAVKSTIGPEIGDLVQAAEQKFGFKLLPGQKTDVPALRARETQYRGNAAKNDSMVEVQKHNQEAFNNSLAHEMGVPDAKLITPQVEAVAKQRVIAQETKALSGKQLMLDPQFKTEVGQILQNTNVPVTQLFGNKALGILNKAGNLSSMDGMDYKWVRSDLQNRASAYLNSTEPGNKEAGRQLKELINALDGAVDRSVARAYDAPAGTMYKSLTPQDLALVKDARNKWKAILTVAESKRGNYNIDPNKWASKAQDWYRPGEKLHELIQIVDNVPDFRASVGTPKKITPSGGSPVASANVGFGGVNARVGEGLGGITTNLMQGPYLKAAGTNYYTPADTKRQLLAQLLGLGASSGVRSPYEDYVTRK